MELILTEIEAGTAIEIATMTGTGTLTEEVSILGHRYRIGIMTVIETVTEITTGNIVIQPLIEVATIPPTIRAITINTINAMLERNTIFGTGHHAIEITTSVIGPPEREMNLLVSPIGMEGTSGIRETRETNVHLRIVMTTTQTPGNNGSKVRNPPPSLHTNLLFFFLAQ